MWGEMPAIISAARSRVEFDEERVGVVASRRVGEGRAGEP